MANNKSYYDVAYKQLSKIIRTGWINWRVTGPRLEDDLEHVFGTQMLAIAMLNNYYEEYRRLDISKILLILANHEIGEIKYGDFTPFDSRKDDVQSEYSAVLATTSNIIAGKRFAKLFLEFECNSIKKKRALKKVNPDITFDPYKTNNSEFAFFCDKLQCDLKAKCYEIDYPNCVDLNNQFDNPAIIHSKAVNKSLSDGNAWSDMWLTVDLATYPYDECFSAVSKEATYIFDKEEFKKNPLLKFFYQSNLLTMKKTMPNLNDLRYPSYADKIMAAEYLAMSDPNINSSKVVSLIAFNAISIIGNQEFIKNLKGISRSLYEEATLIKTKEAKLAKYFLSIAFYKSMDYNEYSAYTKKLNN